ncbi:glucose 1-dehydrogenase [Paenibacillus aurantius]|uniref:Glucose 1-dehydrogenase n=1 Tax=Paenibacillus aurantius TaxID=2918900 RepID=A0AA96RHW6_9BACL|nr:glucose 1-dehydrogenase [Paenibacillus aurantius]WNQ13991.1 glucose 1-dehydrogenase [Paenibacillus aurantius]
MILNGKTAIITGGGSGIGEAAARCFASEGANLVLADWDEAGGTRVANQINEITKGRARYVKADVSSAEDVKNVVGCTLTAFGRLDILFNNAASILPKPLEEVEEEEWDRLMAINLKSIYLAIKYSIPELRKTKGAIINMASLNGLVGQRQNASYAATKGGIVAMTKSLALDYAKDGVRVNCLCPAGVMTPLMESWIDQQEDPAAVRKSLDDMHPLGRAAQPEEVTQAALFLASEKASFITGVALPVEGGASLGY